MSIQWQQAGIRAVRTFVQAFLMVYVAGIAGATEMVDLAEPSLLQSAFVAGSIALASFLQNAVENYRAVGYYRG